VSVAFALCASAMAQSPSALTKVFPLDIPAEPLSTALQDFARQTGLQVAGLSEVVSRGPNVGPLKGRYSVEQAMESLLRSQGLTFSLVDPRTVAVQRRDGSAQPDSNSAGSAGRTPQGPAVSSTEGAARRSADQTVVPPNQLGQTTARASANFAEGMELSKTATEVIVTGSRIRDTGMNTPTPVTVVTSEQLDRAAPGNIIDAFKQLPQFLGGSSPGTTYYIGTDAGQSILNMRGLGENRTLVLLDGARVVPSNYNGTVDINVLPQSLIERVDVVTGGASAAYGSDAVAGVTNFILDTSYTGLKGRFQAGITGRGDAANKEGEATYGTAIGERAHLIASVDYYVSKAVETYAGRNWFQDWGTVTNPQWTATGQGPELLALPHVTSTDYTNGGLIEQPGSALNRLMFAPDGSAVPFQQGAIAALGGTKSQSGGAGFDYAADRGADSGLEPDVTRYNAFTHLKVDLNERVEAYGQALLGHNEVNGRGFGDVMFGSYLGTIFQDNAYLPANVRAIMVQENLPSFGFSRMGSSVDLGVDRLIQTNTTAAFTGGVKAVLPDNWHLNSYLEYGRNQDDLAAVNFPRTDRLFLAMDAVTDPATGAIVCRSTLYSPNNGCVPIDLLGAGRATPQAIAYVTAGTKTAYQLNTQDAFEVSADGSIFKDWAPGAVQLAFGVGYRRNSLSQHVADPTNPTNNPNDVAVPVNDPAMGIQGVPLGFAGVNSGVQFSIEANFSGVVDVKEAFSEFLIPLLKDEPFARQLNLSLAGRMANYTGSGNVPSYKGGLDWQTFDWLRFRGTYSRDVRAADMSERFNAAGGGATVNDPFMGGQSVVFSQIIGGNPNVKPEKADTYTAGVVLQPTFASGFSVSLDWYSINIKDAIGMLGAQAIVNDCHEGDTALCALITRDPVTNVIIGMRDVYLNLNAEKVVGTDLEADYDRPLGGDRSLTFRLLGGYLDEESISDFGVPFLMSEAGTVGNMELPRVQLNAGLQYNQGPFSAYLNERFISAGKRQWNDDEPGLGGVTINTDHVASVFYTDLNFAYVLGAGSGNLQLFVNITNLLDRPPPNAPNFTGFTGSVQTNKSLYDILGRRFVAGVKFKFL
jgi:iron complex outermembrane receptor protein